MTRVHGSMCFQVTHNRNSSSDICSMQHSAPPGALPPGTKLTVGSHTACIKSYISEGGFAHVYVVSITPPDEEGGVACLKRVLVPDKVHLNLLRAEVESMQRVKGHPNIVRYIDSHAKRSESGPGYEVFVLMEYCSRHGLIDFMNTRLRDQLTESEILKIMYDVTNGLACLHYLRPPLIHRDLKIENILISSDGTYKLCDFGSASPILRPPRNSAEFAILDEDIQRYTTAQYRAPEMVDIYKGFPIDEKSDIWALGVFLYKLCYYTTPFEREGQLAILNARYTFPMKPVYSDRLKRIIIATLQPDPRNRPNVYQVLKEVCLMRSVEVPIKDIYAHPVENEEEVTSVAAEDRMAKVTPHSRAEPPSALVRTQPAMPQERTVPEVTPMYRGRPPKVEPDASSADATNTGATLIPPPVSRTRSLSRSPSKSPVFSDPFIMLDTGKNTPGGGGEPQRPAPLEFDLDSYDFESRYPTIEELTKDLTKQPFTFSQPSTKAVTCHDDPGFDQSTDKTQPLLSEKNSKSKVSRRKQAFDSDLLIETSGDALSSESVALPAMPPRIGIAASAKPQIRTEAHDISPQDDFDFMIPQPVKRDPSPVRGDPSNLSIKQTSGRTSTGTGIPSDDNRLHIAQTRTTRSAPQPAQDTPVVSLRPIHLKPKPAVLSVKSTQKLTYGESDRIPLPSSSYHKTSTKTGGDLESNVSDSNSSPTLVARNRKSPPPIGAKPSYPAAPSGIDNKSVQAVQKALSSIDTDKPLPTLPCQPAGSMSTSVDYDNGSSFPAARDNSTARYGTVGRRPPSETRSRPRPVSMYSSSRGHESDRYFNLEVEESTPQELQRGGTARHQQAIIDSVPAGDREQLKSILTGLSQHSNSDVLQRDNHIDSNVDFLKLLDHDNTGRSWTGSTRNHHHRKPSRNSPYLAPPGADEISAISRSVSAASQRHSKRSSMSSLKGLLIGESVKRPGDTASTPSSRSTSDSMAMPPPISTRKLSVPSIDALPPRTSLDSTRLRPPKTNRRSVVGRFSHSTDNVGELASREESSSGSGDSSAVEVDDSNGHHNGLRSIKSRLKRHSSSRTSSIHSRIQMLINRKNSPPPRTAHGYGKYTDEEPSKESNPQDISSPAIAAPQAASIAPSADTIVLSREQHHHRQLSTVSSASSTSSDKRIPPRPQKPAHLQGARKKPVDTF